MKQSVINFESKTFLDNHVLYQDIQGLLWTINDERISSIGIVSVLLLDQHLCLFLFFIPVDADFNHFRGDMKDAE